MREEQIHWFDKLNQKRYNTATTLMDDFAISNMWNSVLEKYSDQAHFIYELLQNANDVKATKSSFKLTKEGLFFKHNGEKHFWVSNPDTEKDDQQNNKLGDINAITAVAQSNKKDHSTIGKFGVGFKAVFQYTETPHIYDPNFQFKISKFIVPDRLKTDLKDRGKGETVFYFPFDKKEVDQSGNIKMSKEIAYADILEKLKKLVYPTLFLTNLQEVKWETDTRETGEYFKKCLSIIEFSETIYYELEHKQFVGSKIIIEKIHLFTRILNERNLEYSIGYFSDKKNELIPKQHFAFCYFPTKVVTNLNFIIHAPFLLTDSREGIKESESYNISLIDRLAELSADSLIILRDLGMLNDDIFNILPYKKKDFFETIWNDDENEYDEIPNFFAPFYEKALLKLRTYPLLPSYDGTFVSKENAYWADVPELTKLFSNEQLSELVRNSKAKWVFTTISRGKSKDITEYIDGGSERPWGKKEPNLIRASLDFENKIANLFSSDFTKNQSNDFLHSFYDYLSQRRTYQDKFKTKPIFRDSKGNGVAAYEENEGELHSILFLPLDVINEKYVTIDIDLLKNDRTKDFIENFGIKKPSLKDEIYNNILPLYDSLESIDVQTHFEIFYKFWKEEGKPEDFIDLIKDKSFIRFISFDTEEIYRGPANQLYYPSLELKEYFYFKTNTKFVDLKFYHELVKEQEDRQILNDFFLKLGVSNKPRIFKKEVNSYFDKLKFNLSYSTGVSSLFDKIIDGVDELIRSIDSEKSLILWNFLIERNDLDDILSAKHVYFYRSSKTEYVDSSTLMLLKNSKWLLNIYGKFVAPIDININQLHTCYSRNDRLINILGFKPIKVLSLTEKIASMFESENDAKLAKKLLDLYKTRHDKKLSESENFNSLDDEITRSSKIDKTFESLNELKDNFIPKDLPNDDSKNIIFELSNFDENAEFEKGIENLQKHLQIKKNRLLIGDILNKTQKYSFDWFKMYLELLTTFNEKQSTQRQKSISFQNVKVFSEDNKYLLLRGSSTYISSDIENSDNFLITFIFTNGKRENISVEGVSKKGQDLLIFCPESLSLNLISRISSNNNVLKIEVKFTPNIDLISRLYKVFINNNYIEQWINISEKLPPLEFIYGPPGTGKTTTICNKIIELNVTDYGKKTLVLTPTNKASDVICKKLKDNSDSIELFRLSSPTDPLLDEFSIYRDSLDSNDIFISDVIASTIHRLPYFTIDDEYLFQYSWDYVIFDEASMIGLHYIVFAIFALSKSNPDIKIIIAGDPKQIPPVLDLDDKELSSFNFQDENIYTLMGINSFNHEEQKIRKIDNILNLTTQYRSVPEIGQLFSDLSYSSLLVHNRNNNINFKQLPGQLKNLFHSNVSFIDVPLNQDNSIFKINKLFYSSYHVYCAILISELIKYFDNVNKDTNWTIGLISPYKAQSLLISKLISSFGISDKLSILSDTVHGFQGDECDIVFFICNPNNYSYSGHKKSLLSKEYIYNVAVSRAKDYLVVLHPFSSINNNPFVNSLLFSHKNNFGKYQFIKSNQIEELIFDDKEFIEKNSYISGHDTVNVFGLTSLKYFIKLNDTAIDIQLRDFI